MPNRSAGHRVPESTLMKVLADRLFNSGRMFAQSALEAYGENQAHIFVLHAALAVELLAKFNLAAINPVLLADRDVSPEVMVWLASEEQHSGPVPAALRSVGPDRALDIAQGLDEEIRPYRTLLKELSTARNGVAHLGETDIRNLAGRIGEILDALHVLAGASTEVLFGDLQDVVAAYLREYNEAEEQELATLVAHAKAVFDRRYRRGEMVPVEALRESAIHEYGESPLIGPELHLVDCPACGVLGQLSGEIWFGGLPGSVYESFEPKRFSCRTCDLTLTSPSLIRRAGLMQTLEAQDD